MIDNTTPVLTTVSIRRVYTDHPSAPTDNLYRPAGRLCDVRAGSALGTAGSDGGGGVMKVKPRTKWLGLTDS